MDFDLYKPSPRIPCPTCGRKALASSIKNYGECSACSKRARQPTKKQCSFCHRLTFRRIWHRNGGVCNDCYEEPRELVGTDKAAAIAAHMHWIEQHGSLAAAVSADRRDCAGPLVAFALERQRRCWRVITVEV